MNLQKEQLRFVILESPYRHWEDPDARDFFGKVVSLKLKGYQHEYRAGVLPLDTTDFVCDHLAICAENSEGLTPLLAFKSMSLTACELHRLDFPLVNLTRMSHVPDHEAAVASILKSCASRRERVLYYSSLTIDPRYRRDPAASALLHDAFAALHALEFQDAGPGHAMILAVLKFKVPRIFTPLGYAPLSLAGRELPPFPLRSLQEEPVGIYDFDGRFPPAMLARAQLFRKNWDARIQFGKRDTALAA